MDSYDIDENEESDNIKKVMQIKKDKHRVEIRKKNIASTLKSKRLALNTFQYQVSEQSNGNVILPPKNTIIIEQSSQLYLEQNNFQESEVQNNESKDSISLTTYVKAINDICDNEQEFPNLQEKVLRCLQFLKIFIVQAAQQTEEDIQNKQMSELAAAGGCECILQFFSPRYYNFPNCQLEALSAVGNIFTISCDAILSLLVQCGVVQYVMELLQKISADILNTSTEKNEGDCQNLFVGTQINQAEEEISKIKQINELKVKKEMLNEIFRTLGNMAGESYELRVELVQFGICSYLNGEIFSQMLGKVEIRLVENIIFLVKNLLSLSPIIEETHREQLIRVLSGLFCCEDINQEAIQDGLLALKSLAKYGNTILRGKMLAYADAFLKLHFIICTSKDLTNVCTALETLKDYMKYSTNQANYVFNLTDNIRDKFHEFLSSNCNTPLHIRIQVAVIDILLLYISGEDPCFLTDIFSTTKLITDAINIAYLHPNNRLNFAAKDLLITAIERANYAQQKELVNLNILQPLIDAIQEDNLNLMLKSLRVISLLVSVANSQINQPPLFEQFNSIKRTLETNFNFKQTLEAYQVHPNQDVHEAVYFLLENFFND